MQQHSDLIVRLTRTLATLEPREPLPTRLCRAFVRVVEGSEGAIAVGFTSGERSLLCATSELASRLEDTQELLRLGPTIEAHRTGRITTSLSGDDRARRWPELAAALPELEPVSLVSIPMRPSTAVMGVITVHFAAPELPAEAGPDNLQLLTNAVGAALIGDLPAASDHRRSWSQRDTVNQATGMVIAQLGLGPEDALAVLRAHAYAEEAGVTEVAARVVAREIVFGSPEARS